MDKDYITMTIETGDGRKEVQKVRGLVFVAQSVDKKNHTVAGSVGSGRNLAKTMAVVDRTVGDIKKNFLKQALNKMPTEAVDELKSMMEEATSKRPDVSNLVDNLSDILSKDSPLRSNEPLPRQKIIN